MKQFITYSEEETKGVAKNLAQKIKKGVIALSGELGAGKTIFVQGFAQGLNIKGRIISPTFVLMRQHSIPRKNKILYHLDLYRLENPNDFKELGLKEIMSNPNNIVLIEWAEKIEKLLPKETVKIYISRKGDYERIITIA